MHIHINRDDILIALTAICRVVERRNYIPILSNVQLTADSTGLVLTATDLDQEITVACACETKTAGATTLPAHQLMNSVKNMPAGGVLSIDMADTQRAAIHSGRLNLALPALPVSDFPTFNIKTLTHKFALRSEALKRLIGQTQFAIPTEETRYYLNGVCLHMIDVDRTLMLRAVTTDGHRLARCDIPSPAGADGMPSVILPRAVVSLLDKILTPKLVKSGASIICEIGLNTLRFTYGDIVITSKTIDRTFPDYDRVIPTGNNKRLTLDRLDTIAALKRASSVSSERGRAVKLSLSKNALKLSVANPDGDSTHETIEADYAGAPLEIGVNARYLLDILNTMTRDTVLVKLDDAGSPVTFQDHDDASSLFVQMPMRV